jgi:Immunity protein 31
MRFGFYEKVTIVRSEKFPQYVGKAGIITGISEDDTGIYGYTVYFLDEGENVYFYPDDLEGTGEFVDRSLLYDENARVRVRVIDGKGSIVE